jgi:hypothetical protein
MKSRHHFIQIPAFLLAFCLLGTLSQAQVTITVLDTFDYPGTGNLTRPQKINDKNDIVGTYVDASLVTRGFTRLANGHFSAPIVDPNDTANFTEGRGINNSRTLCGDYLGGDAFYHGYFKVGAPFTDYNIAGATSTETLGINNAGDFAGGYVPNVTGGIWTPFVSIGGTVTSIAITGSTFATAYQLNTTNAVCGYWVDSAAVNHGYFQDSNGTLHSPVDPPGSTGTILFGNNDQNWIVGRYTDASGATHGVLFIPPRRFVTFDYPGSTYTSLNGINKKGYICGRYIDDAAIEHGFTARAVRSAGSDAEVETNITVPAAPIRPKVPASSDRPNQAPAS